MTTSMLWDYNVTKNGEVGIPRMEFHETSVGSRSTGVLPGSTRLLVLAELDMQSCSQLVILLVCDSTAVGCV